MSTAAQTSSDASRLDCRASEAVPARFGLLPEAVSEADGAKMANSSIPLMRGAVQAAISRDAVDFILHTLNTDRFVSQLNQKVRNSLFNMVLKELYGHDEVFFSSLQAWEQLGLPGGFTRACLNGKQPMDFHAR